MTFSDPKIVQNDQNSPELPQQGHARGANSQHAAGATDLIDFGQIWSTVWRGKWIILLLTLLCALAGSYFAYNMTTNIYRAKTTLFMETQQAQIVDLPGVVGGLGGDLQTINSQIEILMSRDLLGQVVDALDLTSVPEFNPTLKKTPATRELTTKAKTYLRTLIKQLGGAKENRATTTLTAVEEQEYRRNVAIDRLHRRIEVDNLPLTYVLEIIVETESRRGSVAIADTLAELFIQDQLNVKFEASERATTWLTGRVSELQIQLEEAEARVSQFNSQTDLISIEVLQAQEIQLKELRDRIAQTRIDLAAATAELALLQAATSPEQKVELSGDSQLRRLLPDIDRPEVERAFDARFAQILQRLQVEIARVEQQIPVLVASADIQQNAVDSQGADLIRLQQLTREAEAIRLLYEYFLTRLNETAAQEGIQRADSRVLSAAVLPRSPISPNRPLIVMISTAFGIILGIGLVLLLDARRNGLRSARELEEMTGVVVLGQIPEIPRRRRPAVLEYIASNPTSAPVEAVRNLRTSLMLSSSTPPQLIMSTSALPGEGKTTSMLALAQNYASLGNKTLLVEGDIRKQTFRHFFKDLPKQGLVTVLDDDVSLEEAVTADKRIGADVLVAGKSDRNAADIFASKAFEAFLTEARKQYDTILIDTPPVLVVPDARIIARHCDAVLFSVRWDSTTRTQVEEALHMFKTANQPVTGLVLTQINSKRMKSYGYGYSYGAYGGQYYSK